MNSAADRQTGGVAPDAVLLDVSELPVEALLAETSFAWALRRLEQETDSNDESYAAFGNFADDQPDPPGLATSGS